VPLSRNHCREKVVGNGTPVDERTYARLGSVSRHARNTTLLTLARELPPAILADLLGIGTSTADRWRQWAGGTWAAAYQP